MTAAIQLQPRLTFHEFIAWYPERSESRYELHDGVIVKMPWDCLESTNGINRLNLCGKQLIFFRLYR